MTEYVKNVDEAINQNYTSRKELPNSIELRGLACFKCAAVDTCTIVVAPRSLFIATCTKCRYTTRATPRTHYLLSTFAFGEQPSGTEK